MTPKVSVIITCYNQREALGAVLDSIATQKQLPAEVVIADDGSQPPTQDLIQQYQQDFPCPIMHVSQQDHGYRAGRIRNKAVLQATGDYLIFIDGDCLLRNDFIAEHKRLSTPQHFVAGNRVLLSEQYTQKILQQPIDVSAIKPFEFDRQAVNRRWALLSLPMGWLRHANARAWGIKGCNMSMYRSDFIAANGFDESFEGWGYEDSELIVRLLHCGLKRISGRFAVTVIHLWHASNKNQRQQHNWARLQQTINSDRQRARKGIDQHTASD